VVKKEEEEQEKVRRINGQKMLLKRVGKKETVGRVRN
jgi:hypothetical protein